MAHGPGSAYERVTITPAVGRWYRLCAGTLLLAALIAAAATPFALRAAGIPRTDSVVVKLALAATAALFGDLLRRVWPAARGWFIRVSPGLVECGPITAPFRLAFDEVAAVEVRKNEYGPGPASLLLTNGERLPLFMQADQTLLQYLLDLSMPTRASAPIESLRDTKLLGWGLGQRKLGSQSTASVYVTSEDQKVIWVDSDAFWTSIVLLLRRSHPEIRRIRRRVSRVRGSLWFAVALAVTAYVVWA